MLVSVTYCILYGTSASTRTLQKQLKNTTFLDFGCLLKRHFFSILSIPSHKAHTVNIHIICHKARHTVHLAMKMVKILATKEDLAKINICVYFFEVLLPMVL